MVVIRLSRGGSKKRPYFNVVVAESSKKRDGRFIERVGFYNPSAREGSETLRLESERIEYWQSNGAQLSETVNRIVKLNAKGPDGLVAMKKKDDAKALARKNKKAADKAAKVEEAVSAEEEAPKEEAAAPRKRLQKKKPQLLRKRLQKKKPQLQKKKSSKSSKRRSRSSKRRSRSSKRRSS